MKSKAETPNKPVITIIDDDESVRVALMSLMRALGFVSEAYACAEDFLKSGRLHRTSCLIADVRMPGMSGLELHRHLVASGRPIPTVLITAHDEAGRASALKAGVFCYLAKPFDEDGLLGCIPFGPRTPQERWKGLMITAGLHAPRAAGRAQVSETEQEAPTDRPAEPTIPFGPFQLLPTRLLLLEGDRPVRLGSRALEILLALVERPGELVGKNELMARVWPSTFVEEGNLKVQVAGLRRALGDSRGSNRYLATVPGRGYCFVPPVRRTDKPGLAAPQAAGAAPRLPAPMTDMIDRADSVAALMVQLPRQRFVTIVGPGGIGKTTVALAVARGRSARAALETGSGAERPARWWQAPSLVGVPEAPGRAD